MHSFVSLLKTDISWQSGFGLIAFLILFLQHFRAAVEIVRAAFRFSAYFAFFAERRHFWRRPERLCPRKD